MNARWIREDLTKKGAQDFTKDVLNHMRNRLSDYQEMYGDLYNLEATPAESTAYRFAKHDLRRYPNIITAGGGEDGSPYYTNSSHLPVGYTEDVFSALDVQDELQTLYTSGTVFHAFLGERLPDWKAAANIVRKVAENYKLPYYTLSPTYSICRTHGYLAGEHYTCPHCGEKAEVYSRITGYYRPVQNWNDGKSQEFKERKVYDIETSVMKRTGPADACACDAPAAEEVSENSRVILFTTKTCPNCKIAAKLLEDAGVDFDKLYVEENKEMATELGLKQVPALIVANGDRVQKYMNVVGVREFIAQRGAKVNA